MEKKINREVIRAGETDIKVHLIDSFPNHPYHVFDDEDMTELAASIEASEAFIPFSATDLSAEMANKAERYYQVIDEVIELFCADKEHETSKKGVKATGYRKGYTRSLYIDGITFTLNYDRDMWKNPACVETPFWIAIRDKEWDQDEDMIKKHDVFAENKKQIFWGCIFLALEPLQNSTFSEVCEDIKHQIERYIEIIK